MRPSCPHNLLLPCLLGLTLSSSALVAEYPPPDEVLTRRSISRRQTATNTTSSDPESANTTTGRKAGLAWANGNTVDIQPFLATGKVSWYYTWSVWPVTKRGSWGSRGGLVDSEWVPLFWGAKSVTELQQNLGSAIERANESEVTRVRAILGMNEPEQPGQSNMTAQDGFDLWMQYMEPLRPQYGVRLGSPAVSSGPAGKRWLQDFLTLCEGKCNVDFIVLHWYGTDPDGFIAHLQDYHDTFNKTMWVTEWACHDFVNASGNDKCSEEWVAAFMNKTQSFMDQTDWVERYAWFGAMRDLQGVNEENALMDSKGEISSLGRQYVNATADQNLSSSAAGVEGHVMEARKTLLVSAIALFVWMFGFD